MISEHRSTRLGDLLVERAVISRDQLSRAIELQQTRRHQAAHDGAPDHYKQELGEVLIELGYINRNQLKSSLGWQKRIRKTTAVMVFIAPLLTAACGGGGGGSGASSNNTGQTQAPSSLSVSSDPIIGQPASSSASSQPQVEVPPVGSSSSGGVTTPAPVSSKSSSSSKSPVIISPVDSSSPALGSAPSSASLSSSSSSRSILSSSSKSSSAISRSSVASSTSSSAQVNGAVQVYWTAPNQRENGEFLDITELGGYELRYKRKTDTRYKSVMINDSYIDAYYFDNLEGDYEFQIAAFDKEGIYSAFVNIKPM